MPRIIIFFLFLSSFLALGQDPAIEIKKDTISKFGDKKNHPLSTGYYPINFFDVDLKTLIKFNNYEGVRLGFGGQTNDRLLEQFRIGGYYAYGFVDKSSKYGFGVSARLNKDKKMWANLFYSKDIKEMGAFDFLTDSRVYSIFEPRLINIIQFYKYREYYANVTSELTPKLLSEFRISHSKVENIENYFFIDNNVPFKNYKLAEASISFRYSPKTEFFTNEDGTKEYFDRLPKISAQITQGIKGIAESDFTYTKFGLKLDYYIKRENLSSTNIVFEGLIATGDVPLTHLFHSYPNEPNKLSWTGRFSVAGVQSFETMHFGEFYSDKLAILQLKHVLRRIKLTDKWQPELAVITNHALGDMTATHEHFGIPFSSLDHLYNESGLELNKILFGFGLSFAYRYGYYHLPSFEENVSFKFTFNLKV